jgi:glucose-1-phosphate cytidylyltransferase
MQVVILAGGFGTRLGEYTRKIPKPMIYVKNLPILIRIINFYRSNGYNKFVIACGYKKEIIYKFFKDQIIKKEDDYEYKNKNLHISFKRENYKIDLIDTGLKTLTGGRIKKIYKFIKGNNFFLTYGDGLSDVNLRRLFKIHIKYKSLITITIVNPKSKYGRVILGKKNLISKFEEKPLLKNEWINGGFMICSTKIFKFIKNSKSILENDVFARILKKKKFYYYKHTGFWHCIDTVRDKTEIEKILK